MNINFVEVESNLVFMELNLVIMGLNLGLHDQGFVELGLNLVEMRINAGKNSILPFNPKLTLVLVFNLSIGLIDSFIQTLII